MLSDCASCASLEINVVSYPLNESYMHTSLLSMTNNFALHIVKFTAVGNVKCVTCAHFDGEVRNGVYNIVDNESIMTVWNTLCE